MWYPPAGIVAAVVGFPLLAFGGGRVSAQTSGRRHAERPEEGRVMKRQLIKAGLVTVLVLAGCATAPKTEEGKTDIRDEAATTLAKARANDPTLATLLDNASGYAIFPTVGKGAIGVGGAYGKGVLYEADAITGYCDLTQASIGLQLGGQSYSEIIAFETTDAVETFKQGNLRFDAQATAVALKSGAGANAKFTDGVAVFTMDEAGLMFEASIGGQKFSYQPR
jgi:lipid-binding SYLF domain-containing protein